jgi:acetyl-CoA carboxylase biotin carboxyl carrier protein
VFEGEESIKLSRNITSSAAPLQQMVQQPMMVPQQQATQTASQVENKKDDSSNQNRNTVNSPMVGTFYASASPESKPFVTVGQSVKKGDTLCILEAMKMMNQVQAESDGKILEILIDNAEPVEFDQPLFVVE